MSAKVAAAAWDECLVEVAGPPAGWWYVRPVPRSLQHSLGRRSIRRYLASTLPQAHRQAAVVHEQVERLLGLSAGELQLRGREVRPCGARLCTPLARAALCRCLANPKPA